MSPKGKRKESSNSFVSAEVLKEIQSCRPVRLFINKQKRKGNEDNPFVIRMKFVQLPMEKKIKYFQKAIDKYSQLLEEKNINEHVQIEGQLFESVLTKKEQKNYFDAINAPIKPPNTVLAYYNSKTNKEEEPKPWGSLTADEKKPFKKMLDDVKSEYSTQVQNFADDLPERLKSEYLSFLNKSNASPHVNGAVDDDNKNPGSIGQRRKSVQAIPESFKTLPLDSQQKLTRTQLDALHKCKPTELYYEKKVPEDDKPTFANVTAKNVYIRSIFNLLSEKKRNKFTLKSIAKWQEFLELNPSIVEYQIPTLHLLLGKNDDILYYFTSIGLPQRPATTALILYSNEREQAGLTKYWADLSQTTKDEYVIRLSKIKNEYHQKFIEFVQNTLPSDYMRLEFFRNVKYAAKDFEVASKDRTIEKDDGQLKITQYLTKKVTTEDNDMNEFDRIKQQLLATDLNSEQRKLVHRLGLYMNKFIEETIGSKKKPSGLKTSTGTTNSNKDRTTSTGASKPQSTTSKDVIVINGDISSDNLEPSEENAKKKKKKRKRDRSEVEEARTTTANNDKEKTNVSSSSSKKRK